jgi:CDP-glycerol glycerophosphotransferase
MEYVVMADDMTYIEQRKKQAQELSQLFYKMQDQPLHPNKIAVSTYEGDGGYCCSPRYIVEELLKREAGLEIVWLTHSKNREFPENIKVVEDTKENVAYHLSTAKIWIDNYRKPYGTIKREGQFYLQTWHGILGFKPVGLYRGDKFPEIARLVSQWDSDMIDRVISNSEVLEKMYPKKLLYEGETLRTGFPRLDVIINHKQEMHQQIRRRYGLRADTKLLLFMPTFRGGNQSGKKQVISELPSLDFKRLLRNLRKRFSGDWVILTRLHPQLAAKFDHMSMGDNSDHILDVSQAVDSSELIAAADMVLTDYSSGAFDAAFSGIPVVLFADDVQEYRKSRGEFMWQREELPFLIAENNEELEHNVLSFDETVYHREVTAFMNRLKIQEDGKASQRVAEFLLGTM